MAQHGYLRDYDDRDDDRDHNWRSEDRERGSDRNWSERTRSGDFEGDGSNRNFMLSNRDRGWEGDRDRFGSADQRMSHYGREHGYGGFQGDFSRSGREQGGFGGRGDWERAPRTFSSSQDDHYRSWRDRQMEALDRDYADYCREREQQFHSDFDAWRSQRHGNQQPLQTGMTQTAQTGDPTGELELSNEMVDQSRDQADPMANATLGTTSGRRR